MPQKIPGTVIDLYEFYAGRAFSQIEPVFSLTGGLTLAQVREITGLETSTIQNWVRRGWVMQPVKKRYSKRSLLRIILINSARGALQIESIAEIMRYLNGDVEDTEDDIISDEDLFNLFCRVIFEVAPRGVINKADIEKSIAQNLELYEKREVGTEEKLRKALYVMVMAYIAARLKEASNKAFEENIIF